MWSRRHVLTLLAAAPALGSCTQQPSADPAAPWRDPGVGETDPRRFALAHAILAPNPHNTQPWLAALDDADGVTMFCDLERRLPFTDPNDRQITIGLGAFSELYRLAAAQLGYDVHITPFPEGEPTPRLDARPIAHLRLGARGAPRNDALFAEITKRRTNRNPYEARAPEPAHFAQLSAAAGAAMQWTSDAAPVAALRDLTWRAFEREIRTAGAGEETFRWLRFGQEEIARHRDGLSIDGPMIPIMKAVGQLDRAHMVDPDSIANRTNLSDWRRKAETAPAFVWLNTADDKPITRFQTGQAYARLNLAASQLGLSIHPWSQALQEYSEMADLYAEMRAALSVVEGGVAQMLVRIGYADATPPSPRRDLETIIRA
ncbi:MAG: hypothetical protein NW206_12835 [Hyphomonadaceae bacterium]|nr:hypothetical protein [Hyphomonadaceae bacterium]